MKRSDKLLTLAGIVLISFNLRAPMTAVGPVVDMIQADYGLSAGAAGGITALPLLMFAIVSPFVARASARLGYGRTMAAGLVMIALGEAVRSCAGAAGLFVGTGMIGAGIAVGNVLIPAMIKSSFPGRVGAMTGVYTSGMCLFAAVGAGTGVPLAEAAGWTGALASWAVLAAVTLAVWIPQLRGGAAAGAGGPARRSGRSIWRSRTAWAVTLFMGVQSLVFYALVAWLPSIVAGKGMADGFAGTVAFIYQIVSIPATLAVPVMCDGMRDQRALSVAVAAVYVAGLAGLLLSEGEAAVAFSAVLMALGMGGAISLAIAFISLRSPDAMRTSELSGMSQSAGYLLAAIGPVAVGCINDATGSWAVPMVLFIVLMAAWGALGLYAGADVKVEDRARRQLRRASGASAVRSRNRRPSADIRFGSCPRLEKTKMGGLGAPALP